MKNKIYTGLTLILLIATVYIVYNKFSSIQKDSKLSEVLLTKHDSIQNIWRNKDLKFPNSLFNLKSGSSLKDELKENKKEYTLVSYLDADCSNCVMELSKWSAFLRSDSKFHKKVNVIFIASSSNVEMFKYQVYDQAKFDYNIFFDKENEYILLNDLPLIKTYQTVLIKKDKIIYLGSPIKDELFEKELLKIIEY